MGMIGILTAAALLVGTNGTSASTSASTSAATPAPDPVAGFAARDGMMLTKTSGAQVLGRVEGIDPEAVTLDVGGGRLVRIPRSDIAEASNFSLPASFDRAPRMFPAKENPAWMGPPKTPKEFGTRCLYEVLLIGALGVVAAGALSASNAKVSDPFN